MLYETDETGTVILIKRLHLALDFPYFKGLNNPFKVAKHSFQEPMPNSPLLLSYLFFGARFLQESRLTTEDFILAFWLRRVLLPWQRS